MSKVKKDTVLTTRLVLENALKNKNDDFIAGLNAAIKLFSETVWFDVQQINNDSKFTHFMYRANGCGMLSVCTVDRILMTIWAEGEGTPEDIRNRAMDRIGNMDGGTFVTLIGADSLNDTRLCGIQATQTEAINMVISIVKDWNKEEYQPFDKNSVRIM